MYMIFHDLLVGNPVHFATIFNIKSLVGVADAAWKLIILLIFLNCLIAQQILLETES